MEQMDGTEAKGRDLIRRLQGSAAPARELDLEIAMAHQWVPAGLTRDVFALRIDELRAQGRAAAQDAADEWQVPRYTASVDAALSLKPEGCEWSVRELSYPSHPDKPFAAVVAQHAYGYGAPSRRGDTGGKGYAASAALALCAAALGANQALWATQNGADQA